MTEAPAMPTKLGYRPELDGLRCLAIGAVMGLHAWAAIFGGGAVGVDVFFVLSAFLISSLILTETTERKGEYRFAAFYARRVRRLGPALILWLLFLAAPTAILMGLSHQILSSTLVSLLYVGDFAVGGVLHATVAAPYTHIWSLAIEEQFYLVWPLLLVAITRRCPKRRRNLLFAGVLASIAITVICESAISGNYFLPTGHLIPIMLGCLAADLFMFESPCWIQRFVMQIWAALAALAVLAAITLNVLSYNARPAFVVTGLAGMATAVLILHCCTVGSWVGKALALAPLVWVGRRSYGLYLYHRTITLLIPALFSGIRLAIAGPLGIVAALVVAAASYRFVERPIVVRGRNPDHRTTTSG